MTEIVSKDQLKQYIDRVERLEHDKAALLDDIKQVFDEAKKLYYLNKNISNKIKKKKL